MIIFAQVAALVILVNMAAGLVRVLKGPTRTDRMLGAQLIGTGGVAVLILLSLVERKPAILDVALLLALLAAFAAVGFVSSLGRDAAAEPETGP